MPLGTKIRDSIIRKTVRIHREREQIPALSEMPELGAANGQGIIFMHRLIKLEELRTLVSGRLPTAEIRKVTRPILEKFYGKQAARLEKELGQGTKLTQKEVFLIRDLTPVVVARAPEYGGVVSGYNWRVMSNIPDVGTQVPRIFTLVNEGKTFVLRGPYAQNSKVTYRVADSGVKEVTSQELQQGISLPRSAVVEIDGLSIHLENVAKSIR